MSTQLTKGENGKKAITFFQQHNFRVVQLEFDKWRPLSKMIPTNLLQHPMSGKPTWLPGYIAKSGSYERLTRLHATPDSSYPGSQVGLPDMGCCKRLFGIILLSGLNLSNSNCTTRKLCCWKKVIPFSPFFPFVNFVNIFRNCIFLKYYTFKQSL